MFSELCRRPGSRRLPGTRPDRPPHAPRRLLLAGLLAATTAATAAASAIVAAGARPVATTVTVAIAATAATTAPATTAARAAAAPAAIAPPALAEPWDGGFFTAAPAELLAAATAAAAADDGRPVAVLFVENRYSFDEAGRLSHTSRMVYRIKSASADPSWSEAGIGWLPWHQQRPRMRARVVTPDGQEHRLDPKVLEQSTVGGGDPEMFSERQVLRGPLPAIGPGAVVEEEETVDDSAPAFERGTLERQRLGMNVPVRHARIVLEAPAAMPLRYVVELPPDRPATTATRDAPATTETPATTAIPPITPRRETSSGRQRLVFELRDVPPLAPPLPGLPPEAPRQPGIAFANGASWRDIAEAYSGIVDRAAAGAQLADWLRAAGAFDAAGSPGAGVEELNSLAWLLLVRGHADEQALELAQRAAQQPRGKTHAVLHTLGALLAERGRTSEAYQVMTQAVNAADEPVPEEADWYVFGRLAEQYGLPEVARGLYARVEKPAGGEAFSTYHLAQARLAALGAPAPPARPVPHATASKQPAE